MLLVITATTATTAGTAGHTVQNARRRMIKNSFFSCYNSWFLATFLFINSRNKRVALIVIMQKVMFVFLLMLVITPTLATDAIAVINPGIRTGVGYSCRRYQSNTNRSFCLRYPVGGDIGFLPQ